MFDKNFISKAKILQERRTLEAIRKDLMGVTGKLGIIAIYLGIPLLANFCSHEANYLTDIYDEEDPYDIPMAEDIDTFEDGYFFDGLNRGYHFEIKYYKSTSELVAYYQGYLIYKEVAGNLLVYTPATEWEEIVEKLYAQAKEKMDNKKKEDKEISKENYGKKLKLFLKEMKNRWGY